jgi:hypothetical protein
MKAWILAAIFAFPLSAHAQVLGGSAAMGGAVKLSASGSAVGTVTYIQSCGAQQAGSPVACVFSNPVGAGHLLFIAVNNFATGSGFSIAGDSGTVTPDLVSYFWNGTAGELSTSYILSAGGGETAITLSLANAVYPSIVVDEYACSPACSLDTSDPGSQGTSSTLTTNSITTTAIGGLVIGAFIGSGGFSVGTGFTAAGSSPSPGNDEFLIKASAGAVSASASSTSSVWAAHVVAFKP